MVSIVSGAANPRNVSADEVLDMAFAAVKRSPQPVDVVLFPECFLYDGYNAEACGLGGGPEGERWKCEGPHVTACRRVAVATKAYVVCPFYELQNASASQDTGPSFNTAVLLDRTGAAAAYQSSGKSKSQQMSSDTRPKSVSNTGTPRFPGRMPSLSSPVFGGKISLVG